MMRTGMLVLCYALLCRQWDSSEAQLTQNTCCIMRGRRIAGTMNNGSVGQTNGSFWLQCNPSTPGYLSPLAVNAQPDGFPYDVDINQGAELPPSSASQLLTLKMIAADCSSSIPLARSYSENTWELLASAGNRLQLNCSNWPILNCSINFLTFQAPNDFGGFRVDGINAVLPTEAEATSRLLMQGTFGPTNDSVFAALSSAGKSDVTAQSIDTDISVATAWIEDQMSLEPTLLRAHFRERVNPRVMHQTYEAPGIGPCMDGSRWNHYAFDRLDIGRTISVRSVDDGMFEIETISGIVRTESPDFGGSLWPGTCRCRSDHSCRLGSNGRDWCRIESGLFCGDADGWSHNDEDKDVWSYNVCNVPNISGFGHTLLRAGAECENHDGEVNFESQSSLEACAQRCREHTGCMYFLYGAGDGDGCYMENVTRDDCGGDGFEEDEDWDFYKLSDSTVAGPDEMRAGVFNVTDTVQFTICDVDERVGGDLAVIPVTPGRTCNSNWDRLHLANPRLHFRSTPDTTQTFSEDDVSINTIWNIDAISLSGHTSSCNPSKSGGRVTLGISNGNNITYYQHERRMRFATNTHDSPADTDANMFERSRSGTCPSVPKTVLNEESCVRVWNSTCGEPTFSTANITLNDTSLLMWYSLSTKHVHTVRGLRLEEGGRFYHSPCTRGVKSRWLRVSDSGGCSTVQPGGTTHTINWGFNAPVLSLNITVGDTVIWRWSLDDDFHNVVSGARPNSTGLFQSSFQSSGSFSYTFNQTGFYPFYCSPHPGMDGNITVLDSIGGENAIVLNGVTEGVFQNALQASSSLNPYVRDINISEYIPARNTSNDVYGHILLREGVECDRWEGEYYFGVHDTISECAQACRERQFCKYFLFGTGDREGRCYMEDVHSDDCGVDGFYPNNYDFYKLNDTLDDSDCSMRDDTIGAYLEIGVTCWQHSHPSEGSVFDFSRWAYSHPGNSRLNDLRMLNPFTRLGAEARTELWFPGWHEMWRWEENAYRDDLDDADIIYIGEFGSEVDFANLPAAVQTLEMASLVGSIPEYTGIGFEVCGSRGEVGSDPLKGHRFHSADYRQADQGLDQPEQSNYWDGPGRRMTWTTVALTASDQLRQRIAWSLSQILVVGSNDFGINLETEPWIHFYDIFIENAFGNYRDILQEVSISPVMGRYLTMMGNTAYGYSGRFPDENYARELMQLFTIGLWKLNKDGTPKRDPQTGHVQNSYSNDDIVDFARIWTGWDAQDLRGNIVDHDEWSDNNIDPMHLYPERRDFFPKSLLGGPSIGHIGDSYPLCSHLPPQHYLKQGAKYRYHGNVSMLGSIHDNVDGYANIREHMTPTSASQLFTKLCARGGNLNCTFPSVVVLDTDLQCTGDAECNADLLRAVKIVDGDNIGYYTYVEPPCVRLQFFEGKRAELSWSRVCADPSVASTIGVQCCSNPYHINNTVCPSSHPIYDRNTGNEDYGDLCHKASSHWREWECPSGCEWTADRDHPFCVFRSNTSAPCHLDLGEVVSSGGAECLFVAEPVKYSTAEQRCAAEYDHAEICPETIYRSDSTPDGESEDWQETCAGYQYAWTREPCELQVQVYPTGEVTIVDRSSFNDHLERNSGNKFRVGWGQQPLDSTQNFPTFNTNCTAGCIPVPDSGGTCLCDATVSDEPYVLNATVGMLPNITSLRRMLPIGSFPPANYGTLGSNSGYTLCLTSLCLSQEGVRVYTKGTGTSMPSALDINTIFEFTDVTYTATPSTRRPARFLLNRVSTVQVGRPKEYVMLNPLSIPVVSCSQSSQWPDDDDRFTCEAAIDDNYDSRWSGWSTDPDSDSNPVGAWMQVNFSSVVQINTYALSSWTHERARLKRIFLQFSDGSSHEAMVDNTPYVTPYRLPTPVQSSSVRITILELQTIPCIFPFTHDGATYTQCVDNHTHSGSRPLWCAIEVDEDGVSTDWGDCAQDGINAVPGGQLNNAWTGIAEVQFYGPNSISPASSTPCEDAGLQPVSQTECEAAHPWVVPPAWEVLEGDSSVNRVGDWSYVVPGCSMYVGEVNDSGVRDGNFAPHWNSRAETYDWSWRYWPVCALETEALTTGFTFRNPPHFLPNVGESLWWVPGGGSNQNPYGRDGDHLRAPAEYETAALLDHLFEHENTAPFIAYRMIQRLVTSNPSPRYVEAVATAFEQGVYNGTNYSGKYGDMAAMTAAILLDREARSSVLDVDALHGQLREPILKVLHVMRAMDYIPRRSGLEVDLHEMQMKIGQMAFDSPSVFNFFLPEFAPSGRLEDLGLVSPESQLSTAPLNIGFLNGMTSLINYGLTECERGFGGWVPGIRCWDDDVSQYAIGKLNLKPTNPSNPQAAISELAMLLTGGRLGASTKEVITRIYTNHIAEETFNFTGSKETALNALSTITESECLDFVKAHLGTSHIPMTSCSASSEGSWSGYHCESAIDYQERSSDWSSWLSDENENLRGQWITVQFGTDRLIDKMVFAGRCDSNTAPLDRVRLYYSDGTNERIDLHNDCGGKTYQLSNPVTTSYVNITVLRQHTVNCVFPFEYDGVVYNNCTNIDNVEDGRDWCASQVDEEGHEEQWGYCNSDGVTVDAASTANIRHLRFYSPDSVEDPFDIQEATWLVRGNWSWVPPGCSYNYWSNETHYNEHPIGCGEASCGWYTSVASNNNSVVWPAQSTYSGWNDDNAWLGIDGNIDSCLSTRQQDNPWWEVGLGRVSNITSVVVHNRDGWGGEWNDGFDIYVDGAVCASDVPIERGDVLRVPCVAVGSTVRIALRGTDRQLFICEVEINIYQPPNENGTYASNPVAEERALKHVLKLFTVAPEFHTTSTPIDPPNGPKQREKYNPTASQGRPYKAVVVIFLAGGADSFNMVVPHSNCSNGRDLYQEYRTIRGDDPANFMALQKDDLLEFNANSSQPCSQFGLHPSLQHIHQLYNDGDAAVMANMGPLVEPITYDDYMNSWRTTKKFPPGLYSHNSMSDDTWTIHSGYRDAKGVLGRMVNQLSNQNNPYKSAMYTMNGYSRMLDGGILTPETIDPGEGVVRFTEFTPLEHDIGNLTGYESESVFPETFASALQQSLISTEQFGADLENSTLESNRSFPRDNNWLGPQLEEVSKVIQLDSTKNNMERAAFYTSIGGFDTHGTVDIAGLMQEVDDAVDAFAEEMKYQGLWNNVTVVIASEFGRTLASNSQGSDHGWSGNYFVLGGDIKGKRMYGKFPEHLEEFISEANVGRGRYIPTTPWEAPWNAIAEWWELSEAARDRILPNMANFPSDSIFTKDQLYKQ